MDKPTPGQWTAAHSREGSFMVVAREGNARVGQSMERADAHLMAAAPTLVEAAKAAIQYIEETGNYFDDPDCRDISDQLMAAIHLSEGRNSIEF
jgi:hypothetical protein